MNEAIAVLRDRPIFLRVDHNNTHSGISGRNLLINGMGLIFLLSRVLSP